MADDVKVTFVADTSGLDAAITKLKANMQELDPAMVELGGKITAAFKKIGLDPGKAFGAMDPNERQALIQYGASLQTVGTAAQAAAAKVQMVGQAVQQTGAKIQMLNVLMAPAAGGGGGVGGLPPGGIYGGLPNWPPNLGGGGGGLRPPVTTAVPGLAYVAPQVQQTTTAVQQLGNASRHAGIDFGAMVERMVARMVIFEAIRLVLQGIMAVFKEVSSFETARVQFENLTKGAEEASTVESMLVATTKATNIEFSKLSAAVLSLEDAGAGPIEAAAEVDLLGKRAAATGQDVDKLATALEHAKLNEATIPEMFELAHATGTAKDALLDEVTGYAKLTQQIKEVDKARDEEIARMDIAVRQWEKEKEAAERTLSAQLSFTEKLIAAQNQWDQAHGRTTRSITEQFERASRFKDIPGAEVMLAPRGGWGGQGKLPTAQVDEYRRGIAQLAQEEMTSAAQIHKAIQAHVVDYNDVMAAAKRSHEEERRGVEATAQAERDKAAETKRLEAIDLDKQRLKIQQDLVTAIGAQNNITGELGKSMGTVAEQFASVATSLKALVDESPQFLTAMQEIARLATMITDTFKTGPKENWLTAHPVDVGKLLRDISGVTEIQQGWAGLREQFFPQKVQDDTARTANGVEQLVTALTGG